MAKASSTSTKEVGSAFDLLPKSLEIVKNNWVAFLAVNVLTILASLPFYEDRAENYLTSNAGSGLGGFELGALVGATGLLVLLFGAVNMILYLMMLVLQVQTAAGKQPEIGELFSKITQKWLWLRLIGLGIVASVILVIGFLLLIIPGIIAIGRLAMSPYLLIDKDMKVMDAIKASNQMGKQFSGKVWGAIGVTFLISLGTSLLAVIPIIGGVVGTLIMIAYSLVLPLRYQQLKTQKAASK